MCDTCGCPTPDDHFEHKKLVVDINQSLLKANNEQAQKNKIHIESLGAVGINMISSPGSGKTTLLEQTIEKLSPRFKIGVIEGDIETERDAERIRAKGVPVVQITTGGACHLDARLVHKGIHQLVDQGHEHFDIIFIENVGNLVCPATFDLGEHQRIVLLSVPEGSDKPAKYPKPFQSSDGFLITKTDLLPYFDFSIEESKREALLLNPDLFIFELSSTTGKGMEAWLSYLDELQNSGEKTP